MATTHSQDAARSRAIFYAPEIAFDRPVPKVEPKVFLAERDRAFAAGAPTGFVTLDQGPSLGTSWEATTPALLARYLVLRTGEFFTHRSKSNGDVYYVIRGAGSTQVAGETVTWAADDGFCLPGGEEARHTATLDAVLLFVNNEPELSYMRAEPSASAKTGISPTLYPAEEIDRQLRTVHGRNGEQKAAGKSVLFVTASMAHRRVTTPTLLTAINTLEPGGDQRPHSHSSAALTLSIQGENVYSMVGGEKVDWAEHAVIVTPPGAVHSHHNRGKVMMKSFVAQDTGLHTELRTTNFSWRDEQ